MCKGYLRTKVFYITRNIQGVERDDIQNYVSKKHEKKALEAFDKYIKEISFSSDLSEFIAVAGMLVFRKFQNFRKFDDLKIPIIPKI